MSYATRRRAPRHVARRRLVLHHRPPPRRRATRWPWRRRAATALGLLAVISLSTVLWEYVGSSWITRIHQREAMSGLQRAWTTNAPSSTRDGIAVDGIVRIPRFGGAYAVPVVEGSDPTNLALGVGHVLGTTSVGNVGNYVLAGHRVTHGEPFRRLHDLRPGDEIVIDTLATSYVYRVSDDPDWTRRVSDTATWVLAAVPRPPGSATAAAPRGRRLLTLVTCAELYRSPDRLVVVAELLRTRPRTTVPITVPITVPTTDLKRHS